MNVIQLQPEKATAGIYLCNHLSVRQYHVAGIWVVEKKNGQDCRWKQADDYLFDNW
jgi:hypothetical protein